MVLIDRDTAVEQFDYWRVAGDLAVLRLLTSVGSALDGPSAAHLIVDPGSDGDEPFHAPACGGTLERRLLSSGSSGSQLLWQARFAVPVGLLEGPRARFQLTAGAGSALTLPAPWLRDITPRALALTRFEDRQRSAPWIAVTGPRRLAALASAAVITGTSAPALALAAGIAGSGGPTGVSHDAGVGRSAFAMTQHGGTRTVRRHRSRRHGAGSKPTAKTPDTWPTPTNTTGGVAAGTTTTVTTPASTTTTVTIPAPTTVTTPPPAPTTTTTTTRAPQPTTPGRAPSCQSRTGGHMLTIVPAFATRRAKPAVGLSIDPQSARCTPTSAPNAGHKHPANGTPEKGNHSHPGTRPRTGSHPGAQHPRASKPVTGGAPLSPGQPKQPDHTLAPTPSSSSSGGTAETPVPTLSSSPSFVNPGSWTGTVSADPSLTGAVRNLAGLLANGNRPPSFLIPIYMQAGKRYDIPWPVLAAINAVESDYGRNLSTSSAGALGWMQFEPGTWRTYGVSADGQHNPNPYDPRDAIFAAARYLKAAGGSQNIARAVYAYNHAGWYVDMVMSRARAITHQAQYVRAKLDKRGTYSVFFATGLKKHPTVRYSGGVLSHYDRLIAAANMVSAANFSYLYGGGHEQPARWGPFDCSGSVSYVMQQAGYKVPTTVSGNIPSWKFPAGPGAVTIFYNPVHTFMRIGNRYFGTSGFARPGGGAGWFDVDKLPASYLATFREVHVPKLGLNSFSPNVHYVWPKPRRVSQVPLGLPRLTFRGDQR
ncbi:MAG TPA: lytic transglycosylase domain-containing protein [Solirubrobacteraceae bacterium]|nr:lytic transglycosylase domain-containing protein [Solirubrobacteraceae bacterium]